MLVPLRHSVFYLQISEKEDPTSGLEPLTPAPATSDHSGVGGVCRGLQMPHIQRDFCSLVC
jgi:hypothetical protein